MMNYLIQNILVPTDFSASADNALRLAIAMAERHGAKVHLLNVITTYLTLPSMAAMSGSSDELVVLINSATERLNREKSSILEKHSLDVTAVTELGTVANNICTYVINNKIDMVIMGTHGVSGWKEFLIGSSTMAVMKECSCPVLTVPMTYSKTVFDSILYPVRTVTGMVEKYSFIRSIIEKNNSTIHLLGLVQKNEVNNTDMIAQMKKVINVILDDHDEITYETHYCQNLADKILETAHTREDDLIVINATLDTDWKDLFSGSYTQQIINHAQIPVLALKF